MLSEDVEKVVLGGKKAILDSAKARGQSCLQLGDTRRRAAALRGAYIRFVALTLELTPAPPGTLHPPGLAALPVLPIKLNATTDRINSIGLSRALA